MLARRGIDKPAEAEIAQAASDLLNRAGKGPARPAAETPPDTGASRRDQRAAALTRATTSEESRQAWAGRAAPEPATSPLAAAPARGQDEDGEDPGEGTGHGNPAERVRRGAGGQEAMVTPAGPDEGRPRPDAGTREPTMTLPRWRRFVDAPPASFDLKPDRRWRALDDAAREAYDDARISYHSEMVVVATSLVREVVRQGLLLTMVNRRETGARRMMILSGLQTTGKTTALKQLGRTHELRLRERNPGRANDQIPVVYVSTPPKGSPRKLAAEFARFLGLPPLKRVYNTTDITDAVCEILIRSGIELVLVDEIHNLNLGTAAGEDMSDHLKYFTEHLPATFVYAGIDVPRRLSGLRGAQILGRSVVISTGPAPAAANGTP